MAVLNQVLGAPESGWTRYNDNNTSLTYESLNYIYLTEAMNVYQSDIHVLRDVGDKVKFNISGTGFRIISSTYPGQAEVKVLIDGIESGTYTLNKSQGSLILLYEKKGLEDKEHAVVLEKTSGGDFIFDALDVQGELKEYELPPVNKYLFKDGEEIKKYVGTAKSIPVMASNAEDGIVLTASSSYSGYPAWKAFDKVDTTGWVSSGVPTVSSPEWIQIDLGMEKLIESYSFTNSPSGLATPYVQIKDFELKGSNDGVSWIVIHSMTNESWSSSGERKEYGIGPNVRFRYYRFVVTRAIQYSFTKVIIGEFDLFLKGVGWETVDASFQSKELFDLHGMTDLSLINDEAMQQLSSDQVELLCWTDEVVNNTLLSYAESDAVPRMTSNNAPLGVASASSQYSTNYGPWKIFDNTLGLANCWASASGTTQWVQYKFDTAKRIGKMTLTASSDSGDISKMPTSFSLQVSNTGLFSGEEKIIHTEVESLHGFWDAGEKKTYVFENDQEYLFYRLVMTEKEGPMNQSVEYVINEMELFEVYGSSVSVSLKRNLQKNAIPKNMISISSKNTNVEQIEMVNLGASNVKIIASQDNGNTWVGKTQVEVNDLASVKSNGFTPEELNALTKEQLATLFPNGTARFAFYLEQENISDVVEIQSLSVGEKQYTISPTATDLSLIYEVLQEEKPTLYASRDDGVSWEEISQDEMASLSEQPEGKSLRVKAVLKNGQEIHALSYAWS